MIHRLFLNRSPSVQERANQSDLKQISITYRCEEVPETQWQKRELLTLQPERQCILSFPSQHSLSTKSNSNLQLNGENGPAISPEFKSQTTTRPFSSLFKKHSLGENLIS